jgi:hypothetical protein
MATQRGVDPAKMAYQESYEMDDTKVDKMAGTARDELEMERLGKTQQLNVCCSVEAHIKALSNVYRSGTFGLFRSWGSRAQQ